jgi:isopentenyldiphosphate isomerase
VSIALVEVRVLSSAHFMEHAAEILDLVDRDDTVIGQFDRNSRNYGTFSNFRVVNAFMINDAGELWIPRRTANKRIFPNALDMSVGGHVASGEDYEHAFLREAREELGAEPASDEWQEIGYFNPYQTGLSAFTKVYRINRNEAPRYNQEDFSEAMWITPEDLIQRINEGDAAKSDLSPLIRLCFLSKPSDAGA